LEETPAGINAIAGVHHRLYTSGELRVVNIATYLGSLVEELETAMRASGREYAILLSRAARNCDRVVSIGRP
jgi:two-component sensor histidine kinase